MSDPRAVPEEERPLVPEELVPRQKSEDPMRADGSETTDRPRDEEDDDAIGVEDLP